MNLYHLIKRASVQNETRGKPRGWLIAAGLVYRAQSRHTDGGLAGGTQDTRNPNCDKS
jgi:hypothetical protein